MNDNIAVSQIKIELKRSDMRTYSIEPDIENDKRFSVYILFVTSDAQTYPIAPVIETLLFLFR